MLQLDLDYVRQQFPAFARQNPQPAFMENAGGSYMCRQVMQRLEYYYRQCKVQPYHPNPVAEQAGTMMDECYPALARWLNVSPEEVFIGPSTSQNTYVLANATADWLQTGDEVIVTNQDHEANSGAWRRLEKRGISIKEWQVNPETGSLEIDDLAKLFSAKTRLLTFPHCSNILGEVNPVREICTLARTQDVKTVVDGVSFAGHGLPDVRELGADIYLFSLYKVYGPHQGVMVIKPSMAACLQPQNHFFLADVREKKLMPAGPDHAQIAAVKGIDEYFSSLAEHHFCDTADTDIPAAVRQLLHDAETRLMTPLLEYIQQQPQLTLVGPADARLRAPTISMLTGSHDPLEVARRLGDQGILCGAGHFYSYRLLEAMDINPDSGVLRLSMVHYNSPDEVKRAIEALDQILTA